MAAEGAPSPGGRRSAAVALVVCLAAVLALLALQVVDAQWVLLGLALFGIGLAQVKALHARQQAQEVVATLVAVDVEQPAIVGKHAHRHRGTLDTIADDYSSSDEKRLSSKALKEHDSSPKKIRIPGFENATLGGSATAKARRRSDRILGDLETPPWSRAPSGRSERSTTSQMIIDDLQAQIQKLKEERNNPSNPASARSTTSQAIIDELQAQVQKLKEEKPNPSNPPSARSDLSARSETSQRIITDLKAQIQKLQEDKMQTPMSARSDRSAGSARSDASQRVVNTMQSEIDALKSALTTVRLLGAPQGNPDDLKALLRSLQLPEECGTMLEDEGIDFVEDLADYAEADLVSLGFKRGHAKRLLKAAASGGKEAAAADDSPKRALTAPAAG